MRPCDDEFLEWLQMNNKITLRKYHQVKDVFDIYNKNPSEILNKIRYCLIKNRKVDKFLLLILLTSIFASLIVYLAPGNEIRASRFSGNKDFFLAVYKACKFSFVYFCFLIFQGQTC